MEVDPASKTSRLQHKTSFLVLLCPVGSLLYLLNCWGMSAVWERGGGFDSPPPPGETRRGGPVVGKFSKTQMLIKPFEHVNMHYGRSQWPRGLSHELSSLARTLESWVRIPLEARKSVLLRLFCVCVVLCVGRGLATGWSPVKGVLSTV
jgi:hypothetical protein